MESWKNIQRDGVLKSWNKLKTENIVLEEHPIGMKLGDPKNFSDYIMFGGGVTGESVKLLWISMLNIKPVQGFILMQKRLPRTAYLSVTVAI